MREKWAAAGLFTRDEMQTNCCYATQDKTWVRDPDGNEWEAFVVLIDNLPESAPCECGDKVTEAQSRTHTAGVACATSAAATQTEAASCCGASLPVAEAASCCETMASSLVSLSR
jgi:hypothetical protein